MPSSGELVKVQGMGVKKKKKKKEGRKEVYFKLLNTKGEGDHLCPSARA